MDEYRSLSHSTWECKYHVVFMPKCRRKTLYGQLRQYLGEVFRRLAEQKDAWEGMSRNPRAAAEFISRPHYFCVLKGLHRAPHLVPIDGLTAPPAGVITLNDIGAVVAPATALGGIPMLAAAHSGIPIIAVRENRTILNVGLDNLPLPGAIEVNTYLEAAGVVTALKNGIALESLRRPLASAAELKR